MQLGPSRFDAHLDGAFDRETIELGYRCVLHVVQKHFAPPTPEELDAPQLDLGLS